MKTIKFYFPTEAARRDAEWELVAGIGAQSFQSIPLPPEEGPAFPLEVTFSGEELTPSGVIRSEETTSSLPEPHFASTGPQGEQILKPYYHTVSMAQARTVLRLQNLEAPILAFINQLPEPQKTVASTAFEYHPTISMDSDLVKTLWAAMGLSEEQKVQLFKAAYDLKF